MLNQNQQNLIEQNLQMVIINHQDKILSPQVCSVLEESTQKISPQDFLPILFETLLEDEEFIRKNYYLLSQENLSEESQKIVLNNLLESSILGWLWRNAGDIGRGALDLGKKGIRAIQQYVNPKPKKWPLDRFHRRATYIRNPSGVGGKWRYNQGTSFYPKGSPSGFYMPGEYVVDPDTGREVWRLIPGVKPSDFPQPPLEENRQIFNTQQKNLIEQNLQTIIIENKAKIMSEFMHSPEMYKVLIENKTTKRPQEQQILSVLFECALTDEIFIKKHMGTLLKENLSQKEKEIISNDIMESLLGTLWKGIKKLGGWVWDGVKWVWNNQGRDGPSITNPGRRPGRWGDDFMPTWKKPDGTWQTWDPNIPHWPAPAKGPFGGPGSSYPDIGPPPMVPDYSKEILNPYWTLPPEE